DESERPERWDERLPILVLPEEPDHLDRRLGRWLKEHLQKRRNTVRFLVPRSGSSNAFQDRDLGGNPGTVWPDARHPSGVCR
ncbi:hypothetical protein RZS08_28410, partial [Arthrospira platensis SPKY1]|nr:hypothetical protein [Arthrospira platensis SPKY1]